MIVSKHLRRYRQIVGILIEEGFENVLDVTGLRRFAPIKSLLRGNRGTPEELPVRLRHTLERLGPTFVKLGQVASTRPDLLPGPVVDELRKLQDDVEPAPWPEIRSLVEGELGGSLGEVFASFDEHTLASASLGQVYAATLHDGTPVVVKVQRPDVRALVEVDLDIMLTQTRFIAAHSELGRTYDMPAIAAQFATAIRSELDYLTEAHNAERIAAMFVDDDTVAFPAIHWDHTTGRVLTMERLEGIPLNRLDLLDDAGVDRAEVARRGIYAYLTMIFEHGFFHADPHPGNLFVQADGRVAFTDFGRVGTISAVSRVQLADLLTAIIDNDTSLAVDCLFASAGYPVDVDLGAFEQAVSRLMSKYENKHLGDVGIGELASDIFSIARDHHLTLAPDMAMLLATLAMLEGMGSVLDPAFDFVEVTTPYARRIAAQRWEPQVLLRGFTDSLRRGQRIFTELPEALLRLMRRAGQGEFRIAAHAVGFEPIMARVEEASNRVGFAIVVASFVIGMSWILAGQPVPDAFVLIARILWGGALIVGCWYFVSILRSHYRQPR